MRCNPRGADLKTQIELISVLFDNMLDFDLIETMEADFDVL